MEHEPIHRRLFHLGLFVTALLVDRQKPVDDPSEILREVEKIRQRTERPRMTEDDLYEYIW